MTSDTASSLLMLLRRSSCALESMAATIGVASAVPMAASKGLCASKGISAHAAAARNTFSESSRMRAERLRNEHA
eukprot:657098-Prorocentrum_minimum.AAC.1